MADVSTVARPYARALFDIARQQGDLAGWAQALASAAAVMRNEDAQRFLARPDLSDEARVSFVESVCGETGRARLLATEHGKNLLRLLAENDRFAILPEISSQFEQLKARAENKVKVRLIVATEVDPGVASKIAAALERKLGRKVELDLMVDPGLMGGAIIRAEDMVIDGSVRSRLQRLAETLTA